MVAGERDGQEKGGAGEVGGTQGYQLKGSLGNSWEYPRTLWGEVGQSEMAHCLQQLENSQSLLGAWDEGHLA